MGSTSTRKVTAPAAIDVRMLQRVAGEGYGDGAWHGPDLKAALSDVSAELAFWRPGTERHNIAEIALHHAFTVRSVRTKLVGSSGVVEPFVLDGEDWFPLDSARTLAWPKVLHTVASQQEGLLEAISGLRGARLPADVKPFDLVLGVTSHAIYHAGQIQMIKVLRAGTGRS